MSRYNYHRRKTLTATVRNLKMGSEYPVAVQSMTNTDTNDVEASASQVKRIHEAGAPLVRLTTQGEREASAMADIRKAVEQMGIDVALSADVHFNPKAALRAATTSDKVRINPGNFVDVPRTFRRLEFTEEEYSLEKEKIEKALLPFIELCRKHTTAVRLGVNHGSLSDRIMSRYGDTPAGMTESVMEFIEVFRRHDFNNIVVSVKASTPSVMVETVKLVASEMDRTGFPLSLHLGVTEAGDGDDGRIKSAAGIGALMAEGYGDTIRVSLSEPPENEVPVARMLVEYISAREGHDAIPEPENVPDGAERVMADALRGANVGQMPYSIHADFDTLPEGSVEVDAAGPIVVIADSAMVPVISSSHVNPVGEIASFIDRCRIAGKRNPFIIKMRYPDADADTVRLKASADFGFLLLNGYGSAIMVEAPALNEEELRMLELNILQACGLRRFKTEYVACPGCGRTLFDLQSTLAEVRKATSHLKGLKIGVMGCIVNGPGEMADADYGYVGAGPGKVSLYKGKELKVKNIPREEALPKFIALIKENGDWIEPED